ncbi:MAG TPA: hypothetical protein VFS00_07080 [Polyangiaceae bacterium]|nr:hypothetical protein [Polyangiaceae bacterium]
MTNPTPPPVGSPPAPTLRFVRCRVIESPVEGSPWGTYADALRDPDAEPGPAPTMRSPADLSPAEAAQLVACAGRGSDESFTVDELYAPDFAPPGSPRRWIAETAETPVEWWDVVDDAGTTRYQLWLYHADCGLLFEAGTTKVVAQAIQNGSAWELDPSAPLTRAQIEALVRAHEEASETHPDSQLAELFVSLDDFSPPPG